MRLRLGVVLRVFTIAMFGISIFLWIPIPKIPLEPEMPKYLIHPFFMLELISLLSTVIVWVIAALISLHNLARNGNLNIFEKDFLRRKVVFLIISEINVIQLEKSENSQFLLLKDNFFGRYTETFY